MAEKTRYSDEELEEFRSIINDKLKLARRDYSKMMKTLMNADGNDVEDTSPTYKDIGRRKCHTDQGRAYSASQSPAEVHPGT